MDNQIANDLINLAAEINSRPILTEYLTPTKRGFICIECDNGEGDDGTGAIIKDNKLKCGKCQHSFNNINIIAHHLNLSTRGKDFVEVVKFGCQIFGLPFNEKNSAPVQHIQKTADTSENKPFERLAEAQRNLDKFIQSQGGKWRGLSLNTLKRMKAGFLPNVYFPAAKKELPAVVIPNDAGGVYFRSITGKFHKNNSPMATTTIFLPDTDNFDIVITEGQINAASIFEAIFSITDTPPNFAVMASSGTGTGNITILPRLQQLKAQGKKFRVLIAYDNDSNGAGQIAAENALNSLKNASFTACTIDITKTPDIDANDLLNANLGVSVLTSNTWMAVEDAEEDFEKIELEHRQKIFGENFSNYCSSQFPNYIAVNKKFANRKTGFSNLDDEIKTFRPGIYIVGGLPALGKTTFVLQLLLQMARSGETCFYCSYEMEKGFLTSKLLAHEMARIESKNFNAEIVRPLSATNISLGNIYDHDDAYKAALKNFSKNPIPLHIWELDEVNIDSLIERIENICDSLEKPPIFAIDYLQLLAGNSENPKAALDNVLHKIFACRRKTNATFIIISSLNRANYQTEISFEAFKETGNIEYSADVIWGLQLQLEKRTHADVEKAKKQIPREIQLKCLKNRFGSNFDIGFFYYPNCDTFKPMLEYGDFVDIKDKSDVSNIYDSDENYKGSV